MKRPKIVSVVGTRPECIKMAPIVWQLERETDEFEHVLVASGQHREMLEQAMASVGVRPDVSLELMQHNQGVAEFAAACLSACSNVFATLAPDVVLVQGDTTTVAAASLAAEYSRIRVGHVEAGLRSFDRRNPFPEETNRRLVTSLASFHFAPTVGAANNLRGEGVQEADIFVTGNTVVDALRNIPLPETFEDRRLHDVDFANKRILLVTAHRRENHGRRLHNICQGLRELVETFPDVEVVYPVHLNPIVQSTVHDELSQVPGVHLIDPVAYADLLLLMSRCHLILTDSGGIQEEAPSFHKPVLVLRRVTERPELIAAGAGKVVGTNAQRIVRETSRLLTDGDLYRRMAHAPNPFGDGHAAERIVQILKERLCDGRERGTRLVTLTQRSRLLNTAGGEL